MLYQIAKKYENSKGSYTTYYIITYLLFNNNNMKDLIKEYAISTALTFFTGMIAYLAIAMDGAQTFSDLSWGAVILGALFAGLRLVVKSLIQVMPKLVEKVKALMVK